MNILITGGAGYIGSHTAVELLNAGHEIVIIDNLSNSDAGVVDRIKKITNKPVKFYHADIRDADALNKIFSENKIDAVIHFAGLKAVGESVEKPLLYWNVNVGGTLSLLTAMDVHGVRKIIFSSSATVYGLPETVPVAEDAPLFAINPYGSTKLVQEELFRQLRGWNIVLLRYFNPVGAHPSGMIGEDPRGIPNNLMPYVARVATGDLPHVGVFGNDYDTPDGTGYRDYIHVVDLARGHGAALSKLTGDAAVGCVAYNLGTGRAYSVMEMIRAFERACGHEIKYEIKPRRAGDAPIVYADVSRAERELGFRAEMDIDDMCRDAWGWISGK